ncbi:MAG: hypothetical protein IKB97_04265 [Bacteroidaceae bacterium]|nr:hypothetical protein [Bacteroidaceae bacterium]
MKKLTLLTLLIVCSFTFFSSCDEDDPIVFYTGMGTVVNSNGLPAIDFDNAPVMLPVDPELLYLCNAQHPGQRIITTFNYLGDDKDSRSILLRVVYRVLTKPFFPQPTAHQSDSLGHDAANLETVWIAGEHLNVRFNIAGSLYNLAPHFISMICADPKPDAEGYVNLEFRHNANGDFPEVLKVGYVSFPLKQTVPNAKFRISYKAIDGSQRVITVENSDNAEPRISETELNAALTEMK